MKTISPHRTTVSSFSRQHPGGGGGVDNYDSGEYILSVASSHPNTSTSLNINNTTSSYASRSSNFVAAALSNQSIVLYDHTTNQIAQRIEKAHDKPISEIQFFPNEYNNQQASTSSSPLLISASLDSTVKVWDIRCNNNSNQSTAAAVTMKLGLQNEQALCLSLGYSGTLCAVGTDKARISFFDLRYNNSDRRPSGALMGSYVDAHTEEITTIQFQTIPQSQMSSTTPSNETKTILASSSEDGLISIHDPSQPNEEDALVSVLNVGTPTRSIGFFGPNMEGIYALTGNESLSVYAWDAAQKISDVGVGGGMQLRDTLSGIVDNMNGKGGSSDAMSDGGNTIEYLVGCTWSDISTITPSRSTVSSPALHLLAGNSNGDGYIFRIDANEITPITHLKGGHRGCIRDFCWVEEGERLITGGEDARLCEWDLTGNNSTFAAASNSTSLSGGSGKIRSHVNPHSMSGRSTTKKEGASKGGNHDHGRKKKFGSPY